VRPAGKPAQTRTHGCGYGFFWIWVRVAKKYPRITHANHYKLEETTDIDGEEDDERVKIVVEEIAEDDA
jgi:hypothetical protein